MKIKENQKILIRTDQILYRADKKGNVKFYILNKDNSKVKSLNSFLKGSNISFKIKWDKTANPYRFPYLLGKPLSRAGSEYDYKTVCSVKDLKDYCKIVEQKVKKKIEMENNAPDKCLDF